MWRAAAVLALFGVAIAGLVLSADRQRPPRDNFRPLALGANVADLKNVAMLDEMGLPWMKGFLSWARIEPEAGTRDWSDLEKIKPFVRRYALNVLLRVDRAPGWSHPSNPHPNAPPDPDFYDEWADFLTALARRGRGTVAAYEIWNEPNLTSEWGGKAADPEAYAELLRVSYGAVKQGDPTVTVVGFSLAPTAGAADGSMDTLEFLERGYAAGAAPYFDALGAHPYGFDVPPSVEGRFAFRSVEFERDVMLRRGDGDKPVWATEWGWLIAPSVDGLDRCLTTPAWRDASYVDEQTAASYLAESVAIARDRWPWMEVMLVFNLDFSTAPWYQDPCEPMLFHSLVNGDSTPRATYFALAAS